MDWNELPKEEKVRQMVQQYHEGERVLVLVNDYNGRYLFPRLVSEQRLYKSGQIVSIDEARVLLETITNENHYGDSRMWLEKLSG